MVHRILHVKEYVFDIMYVNECVNVWEWCFAVTTTLERRERDILRWCWDLLRASTHSMSGEDVVCRYVCYTYASAHVWFDVLIDVDALREMCNACTKQ